MNRFIIAAMCHLAAMTSAIAESCADYGMTGQSPWVVYGGTIINTGAPVYNPTPFSGNGIIGEVSSLPFTVPTGKVLYFERATIEPGWGLSIIPYIGPTISSTNSLDTYVAGPYVTSNTSGPPNINSTQEFKSGFFVTAGKQFSIRLDMSSGGNSGYTWEWSLHGFLCNSP